MDDKDKQNQPLRQPESDAPMQPAETNSETGTNYDADVTPTEFEPATDKSQYAAPASPSAWQPAQSATSTDESTASNESSQPQATSPFGAPASTTQPNVAQQSPQYEFTPAAPEKKSNKGLLAIIAAVAAVLLIGGGVAAYKLWYQNPEKVVLDSIVGLAQAKSLTGTGTLKVENKTVDLTMTVKNENTRESGHADVSLTADLKEMNMKFDLAGEGTYTKEGDLYVKAKNLDSSYKKALDAYVSMIEKQYDAYGMPFDEAARQQTLDAADKQFSPIVTKLDNQWIKISADELKDVNKSAGDTQACITKSLNMLRDDKSVSKEVADAYRANKFILIKKELGSKDGSLGYELGYDKAASKKFGDALESTAFGKQIKSCDSSSSSSSSSDDTSDDLKDTTVEVWANRWTHDMTKFSMKGTTQNDSPVKLDFQYSPKVNQSVTVETPKDFMTIKQLQDELSSMSQSQSSLL